MAKIKVAGNTEIWVDNALGTSVNMTAYVDIISALGREFTQLDTTSFVDTAERVIAGIETGQEFTISGVFDDAATTGPDVVLAARVGSLGSWIYAPGGTASGKRKFSGEALCVRYTCSAEVKGFVKYECVFKQDNAATVGTW